MKKIAFVGVVIICVLWLIVDASFALGWRWSDPEGNDVYRFFGAQRLYLFSNPYQDIWGCYRKGRTEEGAPLLVKEIPAGSWRFETAFKARMKYPSSSFGLILWDGRETRTFFLLFEVVGKNRVKIEGSIPGNCRLSPLSLSAFPESKGRFEMPFRAREGFLMVKKVGSRLNFLFRRSLNDSWKLVGSLLLRKTPFKYVGFFARSTGEYSSSVEFFNWKLTRLSRPSIGPYIESAVLYGLSSLDYVGPWEEISPDGYGDGRFAVRLKGKGVSITAIEIRNVSGRYSIWNTIPGDGKPVIAVTDDWGNLLNLSNGSVNIPLMGSKLLYLYVWDNGSINDPRTRYRITIWFSNGRRAVSLVKRKEIYRTPLIVESCTVMGNGPKDLVSSAEVLRKDYRPDLHLILRVKGNAVITGIELYSTRGGFARWDTYYGNGYPVIAVTDGRGKLLSAYDGSIYIRVAGKKRLNLWCYDNSVAADRNSAFRIVITLANGKKVMAPVKKAWIK
ncbi:MAG: hypothetical protein J7M13_06825 [Synergistetes bacterium]|nr:hypothetical protein [Synergistota bacterium]